MVYFVFVVFEKRYFFHFIKENTELIGLSFLQLYNKISLIFMTRRKNKIEE